MESRVTIRGLDVVTRHSKRSEEWVASNLAPLPSWRENFRLDFANNRVSEAAYVANHANKNPDSNQSKAAKTVNELLDSYEATYETHMDIINKNLNSGKKLSKTAAQDALDDAVNTYTVLQLLRLQAPASSQLAVLTSIDDTQRYVAAIGDTLGRVPLSAAIFRSWPS